MPSLPRILTFSLVSFYWLCFYGLIAALMVNKS
jgi:hypothetical protein